MSNDQPQTNAGGFFRCWIEMPNGEMAELTPFVTNWTPIEFDSCEICDGITSLHGIYRTEEPPVTLRLIGRECEDEI